MNVYVLIEGLWKDDLAAAAVLLILCLLLASMASLWVQTLVVKRDIDAFRRELPKLLRSWQGDNTPSETFWGEFRRNLVFRVDASRIVVRESLEQSLRNRAVWKLRKGLLGWIIEVIGEHLTAIALVLTFLLLGAALLGPIQRAVTDTKSTFELARALGQMGAKFFVSAIGLFGAWVFQRSLSGREEKVAEAAAALMTQGETALETVSAFDARMMSVQGERLAELRTELAALGNALTEQLGRLESINVSVQGIGNEVTAHAGNLLKQQVGDVIRDALTELNATASDVADKLSRQLSASFTASMDEQTRSLQLGLSNVHRAIESQPQGNLEKIVDQLRNVVSGGFKSQSEDMGRQLEAFVQVIPKLEAQISSMVAVLGQNAEAWGERNQRASEQLTARMEQMLGQFEASRAAMDAVVATLGRTAVDGARAMGEQMSQWRRAASEDALEFERRAKAFADAIAKTQSDLSVANKGLGQTVMQMVTLLKQVAEANRSVETTLGNLTKTAQQLTQGAERLESALTRREVSIEKEEKLLQEQQAAMTSFQDVIAEILKGYDQALAKQSQELAEGWQKLAGNVKRIVDQTSNGLMDSIEELRDVVVDLRGTLKDGSRRPT